MAVGALIFVGCVGAFGLKGGAQAFPHIVFLLVVAGLLVTVVVALLWLLAKASPTILGLVLREAEPATRLSVTSGNFMHFEVGEALDALDWFQLEKLVGALFEAKGNSIEMRGGAKADGGIDIVVRSGASSAAVQCKHWAKWKCGPAVVRELLGAMAHEGFKRGFLVCRTATDAAKELAESEGITIVDRDGLLERIRTALDADTGRVRALLFDPRKLCPKCGSRMVRRVAAKGRGAGSEFWGCSTYPKCNQTMSC